MGWEDDNLWETTDNGATWNDVSGSGMTSIPNAPISALALHRNLPGWLFVGTDIGVFMSGDNGATWSTQPNSLGTVPVEQLLWKNDHTLLAVTHGRGMYLAFENSVIAEGSKLLDGVRAGTDLSGIFASDNQYMHLDPAPTTNPLKQKVHLLLQSTISTPTPAEFQFRIQSRMNGGPSGDVLQSVDLLNYTTGLFEQLDVQAVADSDETVLIVPTGDTSRFVNQVNNEVTAGLVWEVPAFSGASFFWSIDVDEAVWLITE
jgi:hypothetical protein